MISQKVSVILLIGVTLALAAPVDNTLDAPTQDLQVAEAQHTSLYGYNSDRYPNYPHVFAGYPFDYNSYMRQRYSIFPFF